MENTDLTKEFGFTIPDSNTTNKKRSKDNESLPSNTKNIPESKKNSFITPDQDDGSVTVTTSGYYGTYLELDVIAKNEADLISRYRQTSMYPDVDTAINEIVSDAISAQEHAAPVEIDLEKVNLSVPIKNKITDEFKYLMKILDMRNKAHELFYRWYVDGRIYFQKIVNEDEIKKGILELRYIDPRKIKKVKEVVKEKNEQNLDIVKAIKEYFIYDDRSMTYATSYSNPYTMKHGTRLSIDSIAYAPSGQMDMDKNVVTGYLHKAIKPVNQLKMLADSLVIYRISRAPERRIFYIDVGNLPKTKAEQYMKDIMNRYRNKIVYDSCLAMDTKVPLLDGRTLTIDEISKQFREGNKQIWVYSCNPETGEFAPGLVTSANLTRKNEKVMKLTFDNGETLTCTYDHKFPTRNKGIVEAKDLEINDSMLPLYTRNKSITKGKNTYEQIMQNNTGKWEYTHRLVSKWKDDNNIKNEYVYKNDNNIKKTVHHINYNRYDNSPENLTRMNRDDHFDYHKQHCSIAGKIGGSVTAKKKRELGLPYFTNVDKEKHKESATNQGKQLKKDKKGIFGMSAEQKSAAQKKCNDRLNHKLKTDKDFRQKYCDAISRGWTEDQRKLAAERASEPNRLAKLISLKGLGNKSRWEGINREQNIQKQREICKIIYPNSFGDNIFNLLKTNPKLKYKDILDELNKDTNLISEFFKLNQKDSRAKHLKKRNTNFNYRDIDRYVKSKGFNTFREYRNSFLTYNHKIVKIEHLDKPIDVGTLGIDRDEIYHNYHTFALDCGIYTCNSTGEIRDSRKFMTMLEDFWLPRREGGKGTEITTLPGGSHLDEIADIEYFQDKVYQSLNVPTSRFNQSGGINFGRAVEISREELKFAKFIDRLRKKFSVLFDDILKTQLILKNIITEDDWFDIKDDINYVFSQDQYFQESKDGELLRNRMDIMGFVTTYAGVYFSKKYIQKNILKLTDEEIEKIDKENEEEENEALKKELDTRNKRIKIGLDSPEMYEQGEEDSGGSGEDKKYGDLPSQQTGPGATQARELSRQVSYKSWDE